MKGIFRLVIVMLMVVVMTIPAFGMPVEAGNDKSIETEYEYASDRLIVKFAENATAAEKMSIKAAIE